jgi:hypothetical protein
MNSNSDFSRNSGVERFVSLYTPLSCGAQLTNRFDPLLSTEAQKNHPFATSDRAQQRRCPYEIYHQLYQEYWAFGVSDGKGAAAARGRRIVEWGR